MNDDDNDRPRRDYSELMPIGLAAILTAAAVSLWFFHFSAGAPPRPPAAQPAEVTIGIGQGQTIHPKPPPP